MDKESDDPRVFTSAVISSEELLRRARTRLRAAEAAGAPGAPPDGEIDLDPGDSLVDGWYEVEDYAGVPVRWAARRFDFTAEVGAATHVEMEALLPEDSGLAELRARLFVNDCPGDAFRFRQGWNHLLVAIPAGVSGPAHFSIAAESAWCPLECSVNDDGRELSVCVRRLALVRLELPRLSAASAPAASAPVMEPPAHASEADLPGRFELERWRRLARIPELEFRIERSESRLGFLAPRLGDVLARVSNLETRVQHLESVLTRLVSLLELRLAAIEQAQRELRADINAADGSPPAKR